MLRCGIAVMCPLDVANSTHWSLVCMMDGKICPVWTCLFDTCHVTGIGPHGRRREWRQPQVDHERFRKQCPGWTTPISNNVPSGDRGEVWRGPFVHARMTLVRVLGECSEKGLTSFLHKIVDYSSGPRWSHLKVGACTTRNDFCRSVVLETVITTVSSTLGRRRLMDESSWTYTATRFWYCIAKFWPFFGYGDPQLGKKRVITNVVRRVFDGAVCGRSLRADASICVGDMRVRSWPERLHEQKSCE